ncbi:D-alanyl-D-alanine carboxypeptidase [Achromatium sp. WMS2]|nr:D-alanyl-D-alanine carboxypeptidase [Achromatium sp. WMS2]
MKYVKSPFYIQILFVCTLSLIKVTTSGAESVPPPPSITSKAHILVDYHSGQVLAAFNPDQRLEPASLTKIMSADVIFKELTAGHIKLTDDVLISEHAWRTGGSRTFAEVGKHFTVETLLRGAIIQSGNDATVALAEHIAGSEQTFAEMMNTQAKVLGLTNSHFMNATGLPDPDHYSSAHDMARIATATIREYPNFYKIYSQKEYEVNGIKQRNRNRLLWRDSSVDGIKTGHTEGAGFCLVASAQRGDQRLISVIMGSKNQEMRAADSLTLLNYGFRFYETHKLYEKRQVLGKVRVWKGAYGEVDAGPAEEVYVTVPRQQYENLELVREIAPALNAPVRAGQKIGQVVVRLGGKEITQVPLVALTDAPEGGMFRYLMDTIILWFN